MINRDSKDCPYCGEEIKVKAIKCKHCHSALDAGSPKEIESTNVSDKLFISDKTSGMLINETTIYCHNCGSEVKENAVICISCGVNILNVSKGVNSNIGAQEMVYQDTQKTLPHKDNTDSIVWNKGTYNGQIRDGKPHGEGTWYSSYDGAMLFGIWDKGKFIRSIRTGSEIVTTKNNNIITVNHCRNCGSTVNNKNDQVCLNCGFLPLTSQNYCQECGGKTDMGQEICMNCGFKLLNKLPVERSNEEDIDLVAGIIGFLLPIVGLILYLVWNENKPGKAKSAGYGAILGFFVGVIFFFIILGTII